MALYDLCGKALGVPVYNLLGGRYHVEIPWFAFLQGDSPEELAENAVEYVGRGFDPLYLKVGQGEAHDLATVAAVRNAVGPKPRLRLDANESWDRFTALGMARRLAGFDIDWLEQPTPFYDIEGVALLRAESPIRIALDQAIYTDYDILRTIRAGAADVVVLGFHETGGLLPLRKAAAVAAAGGIALNRHGVLGETGISTLAALQILSTIPNLTDGHQVMHQLYVEDILVDGLISIEGGRTAVPDRPGLGVELDWDRVAKFERLYQQVGQYNM
jgi:L-alanine-DL-glutamate epimerase-like enolase superfamily enzyme